MAEKIVFGEMLKKFNSESFFNVGTIGHVDHGKTTLSAAISKYCGSKGWGNPLSYDDIAKGDSVHGKRVNKIMTINVAHFWYRTDKRVYQHQDCPGHEDFIRNMIVGASQMEGAILVFEIGSEIMPQTKQHLLLVKNLGIEKIIVFLNKVDKVIGTDEESNLKEELTIETSKFMIKEELKKFGFSEDTPLIVGSAHLALKDKDTKKYGVTAIKTLLEKMDEWFDDLSWKKKEPFLMTVDGTNSVPGIGTVLTGKVSSGELDISKGKVKVNILGYGDDIFTEEVKSIGSYKDNKFEKAVAGMEVGLAIGSVPRDKYKTGMVVAAKGTCTVNDEFSAELVVFPKEHSNRATGFKRGFKPVFCFGATMITGELLNFSHLSDVEKIISKKFKDKTGKEVEEKLVMPGDTISIEVKLDKPVFVKNKGTFVVREGTSTIASGRVTQVGSKK